MLVTRLFEHASDARAVPAGTTIFREGDPGDFMFLSDRLRRMDERLTRA